MVEESDKQVECGDPKRKSIHPTPRVLRGSCLCGGIRYEVDPTVISKKLAHCHCKDCRKHCGAAFSTYAEVPIASIRFTSTSTSTSSEASKLMKSYTASNGSVRQFCSVCGSSLTFRGASQTESIEFSLATLYGDGYKGAPRFAPFDKIIITAGATSIPQALIDQLKPGGIMVIPVGDDDLKTMVRIRKGKDGKLTKENHGFCRFVPLLEGKTGKKPKAVNTYVNLD